MHPTSLVALQNFQVVKYDIYKRVKTRLFVVLGDAAVSTKNAIFVCICRRKEVFFLEFFVKAGDCL